jgi:hypothetical protein
VGKDLARRVLEARNLVQVEMVELFVKRLPSVVKPLEIDEPAGVLVHRPGHGQFDAETMSVKARTLVPGGNLWQPMGRFESELVHKPDVHGN